MELLTIVKIGGHIINQSDLLEQFLNEFSALPQPKILVHGGGEKASNLAKQLGIEVKMHKGKRITDEATLKIITMVYGGLINNQLTAKLHSLGHKTLGISGADLGIIKAKKRAISNIDYGYAGDIILIDSVQIQQLLQQGVTPIFAPLTSDEKGQLLNTNADTIAATIASAMQTHYEVKLHYCFEHKGVLSNIDAPDRVIPELSFDDFVSLQDKGVIKKGMLPKLENGFSALNTGVKEVTICHFSTIGVGTKLVHQLDASPKFSFTNQPLSNIAEKILQQLIKIPSISRKEAQTARFLSDCIHQLTGEYPHQKHHNLWIKNKHFNPDLPSILLCSHHDTVSPVKSWSKNPYIPQIEGDKLYGLGSNDAGAALVSLLATFLYYNKASNLPYNLIFAAVAEEEISGQKGIASILEELGTIDLAIIGEPTQMKVAIAEKGLMVLEGLAQGQSGHAARKEGINAISIAQADIAHLESLELDRISPILGAVNIAVTQINAGYQHNIIPDSCHFVVDVRTNECYSNIELFELLQKQLKSTLTAKSFRLAPSSISLEHPIVKKAQQIGLKTFGSATLSDQALIPFSSIKIGPGDSKRSHTADEYILLSELKTGIQIYINLLNKLTL
ncbi:MAG: acetylornithine deacetylase [Aureispira sp.]|jgi:acetylornithine deacetylase